MGIFKSSYNILNCKLMNKLPTFLSKPERKLNHQNTSSPKPRGNPGIKWSEISRIWNNSLWFTVCCVDSGMPTVVFPWQALSTDSSFDVCRQSHNAPTSGFPANKPQNVVHDTHPLTSPKAKLSAISVAMTTQSIAFPRRHDVCGLRGVVWCQLSREWGTT